MNIAAPVLHEDPSFRATVGQTLRPGGLGLTLRGLELAGLVRNGLPVSSFRVVDAGCGTGATVALLLELGFRVTGVDPSVAMLAEASAQAASRSGPVSDVVFLPGTAQNLPVSDASQDAVLCECVLSLTPDPGKAVADMARVLRTGGVLLLTDICLRLGFAPACRACADKGTGSVSCLAGALPVDELLCLLTGNGFVVETVEHHDRALSELAARLIFNGEDLAGLTRWLGRGCEHGSGGRDLLRRLGYLLAVARKI